MLGIDREVIERTDNLTLLETIKNRHHKKLINTVKLTKLNDEEKEKIIKLQYHSLSIQEIKNKYIQLKAVYTDTEDGKVKVKHLLSTPLSPRVEKIQELVKVYNILKHLQEIEKLL